MFADINGTRLYFERQGSGPTLLFIHGTTLDHRMWRRQVEAFASRYDVITYDARGFGQSALPTGAFCHYQDAGALLDHLGVQRAVVVGHSSGGLYALELALARPEQVAACGLICAGIGAGAPFPADLQLLVAQLRSAAAERGVDAAKAIWRSCSLFAPLRGIPAARDEFDAMIADYSGWYWLHGSPAGNLAPPVHERLESIAVPALVVDGGRDHAYNNAIADVLAARIPGATRLRLPQAGHMASMEEPAAVTRALAELAEVAFA
ncbi:alpha/beta fold hydrolase [Ramlibacter solisilvae]|uniref:AB hydrolase-1 domain-containing protein n=1 Tax=Ramlibacter tataouinensis TaxID=94132 RepID=A0A127JRG9_9BURK|nr:alpha/beta fold hydrolase [Ramlibacter tataouinensis]AMO22624.1 hypothetical protein UC35_06670 [Ramlibacter tataouinensis]